MKKNQRILKNTEFSSIISKKQSNANAAFVLYTAKREQDKARVGISVGKKIGNAVIRNRTKRQVRALIDSVYTFNETFDSIVIVRPAFKKMDYEQRSELLSRLHDRAVQKNGGRAHEKKSH